MKGAKGLYYLKKSLEDTTDGTGHQDILRVLCKDQDFEYKVREYSSLEQSYISENYITNSQLAYKVREYSAFSSSKTDIATSTHAQFSVGTKRDQVREQSQYNL